MQARPPSILLLNRTFPPQFGATGRVACDLALHFRAKGHQVTVITSAPTPKTDQAKNLTVIRVEGAQKPNGAWAYYKILKRMERAAKKLPRHDVVISLTDPHMTAHIGHKIAQKMNAKHVHWVMDLYPDLFPVLGYDMSKIVIGFIHHRIYGAMKRADRIVTIGKCMARHLTHKSVPRQTMHVIENWPERPLLNDTAPMPFFNDGETAKFRILYAGTIGLAHDFDGVLRAAHYFQKSLPDVEFIFVGKGGGLDALSDKARKLNLSNIRFLSHQPTENLKSLMEGGDVHLVTLKNGAEGLLYPSKFYSACAVGRPIIYVGPEGCDIHKTIKDSSCGVSIRNLDHKDIIRAIMAYRSDGALWHTHAKNAAKITAQSPAIQFKQWDDLIASLK